MEKEDKIFYTYIGRYTAIDSFIKVFAYQIKEAIDLIQNTILEYKGQLKLREFLNLSLNLSALLLTNQDPKNAIKIINQFNKSDAYYQNNMGKEWLLRKEMIRTLILIELKHIDLAEKSLNAIKHKNTDLFKSKQFLMVDPYKSARKIYKFT